MSNTVEERLAALGHVIPDAPAPAANYVPFTISGDLVFISGQVSMMGDQRWLGKLGADASVEQGKAAAEACALNLIAQLRVAAGGDLERVAQIIRLGGFVNAAAEFTQHPEVLNGASNLMAAAFGEKGAHARAAVGCSSLPRGVMVEVEMTARLNG